MLQVKQLRDKKKYLLDKENKLLDEEKQLLDEKNKLIVEIDNSNFLSMSRTWNSRDIIQGKPETVPLLQDFAEFRMQENGYLVDKTGVMLNMISKQQRRIVYRRPRRFGKSLTLSTLKYFFFEATGLFQGLEAYNMDIKLLEFRWSPSTEHHDFPPCPVLSFDFGMSAKTPAEFRKTIIAQMLKEATACGLVNFNIAPDELIDNALDRLVAKVSALRWNRWKRVVILVDEYDAMYPNCQNDADLQGVEHMIWGFFRRIKSMDGNIVYCFVMGTQWFGFSDIYSGANNFVDLTYNSNMESLCGITNEETSTLLQKFGMLPSHNSEELLEKLRREFNGYSFDLNPRDVRRTLFNPYFIARFANARKVDNFWGDSACKGIMQTLKITNGVVSLPFDMSTKALRAPAKMYDSSPPRPKDAARALLDAGYGTIVNVSSEDVATIDFPNLQTKRLIVSDFISYHITDVDARAFKAATKALKIEDLATFLRFLNRTIGTLPYLHAASFDTESAWFTMLHNVFAYIGLKISAEAANSTGRSDIVVVLGQNVYILDLKVIDASESEVKVEPVVTTANVLKQIVEKKHDYSLFVQSWVQKNHGSVRYAAVVINKEKSRRRFEYVSVASSQGEKIVECYL